MGVTKTTPHIIYVMWSLANEPMTKLTVANNYFKYVKYTSIITKPCLKTLV